MKSFKKILALILSVAMVLGLASTASAAIVIDDEGQDDTINVTFYDGDTAIPEISTIVSKGSSITLPSYSKAGMELDGWKIDNEGTLYEVGETYTVQDSVDFYAQFSQGDYVAIVTVQGGSTTNCTTMEQARVAALAAGDTPVTIQLLADTSISGRLQLRDPDGTTDTLARNITIDLNGFTLSKGATMNGFFFINKQATLTVKGGTLDCKSYAGYMFAGNSGATTIVESGTYTNFGSIASSGASEGLKISGGTWDAPPIDNLATGYEVVKNADGIHFDVVAKTGDDIYSLSDGTNEATFASMDALQVAIDYFAGKRTDIKLLKDVTTDARIGLVAGTETVPIEYNYDLNGHTLTYTGSSQGFVLVRAYDSLNINDTAEGGGVTVSGQSYYFTSNKNPGTLTVNAGTYAGATSFANSNTNLVINGGTWNIDPTTYVDATKYEVVESSGTYTVKPLVEAETYWTVDGVQGYGTFDEAVAAAITGTNATIKLLMNCAKTEAFTTVTSGTTLTLNLNGKNLTTTYTGDTASDTTRRLFVVANGGVLYIVDNSTGEPGTMTGHANYTGNAALVFAQKGGKVYITGGKFHEGAEQSGSNQGFSRQTTSPAGMFYISGGYFTSNTKPGTAYLAENCEFVSDSTYTGYTYKAREIPAKEYVSEVTIDGTTTPYETFDEAIAAAAATTSSATIKLLMDCEKTSAITTIASGKTVTLDLNGHALTNAYSNTNKSSTYHRYFKVNGTLTITDTSADKTGSITVHPEYTGKAGISYADGGTVNVNAGCFFNGAAQAVSTNNCWQNTNGGTHVISGGWFAENARPTNSTAYVPSGSSTIQVLDVEKAATPYTISSTKKTINYSKNAKDATGSVESATEYYLEGYTTATVYAKTNQYTYTNYSFMGWSTDSAADPDSPDLVAAGDVLDLTQYASDTIQFYAIWKEVVPSMWVCVKTGDPTVGYASIAAGLAAQDDITLIKNYTARDTITGDGRINLNGYNIIPTAAGSALVIKSAVSIYNEDAGTITVEGIDYNFGGEGIVRGVAQGTGGAIDSSSGTVKIYGGTFEGYAPKNGTVLTCSGTGQFLIYGGIFASTDATSEVSTFYANNGAIYVIPENQSDVKMAGTFAKNTSGEIGIQGGYFSGLQPEAIVGNYDENQGMFTEDTTKELTDASGDADYKYCVADKTAVFILDGKSYSTESSLKTKLYDGAEVVLTGKQIDSTIEVDGISVDFDFNNKAIATPTTGGKVIKVTNYGEANVYNTDTIGNATGAIESEGFVYIEGELTTTGVVNQTKTVAKNYQAGALIETLITLEYYPEVALATSATSSGADLGIEVLTTGTETVAGSTVHVSETGLQMVTLDETINLSNLGTVITSKYTVGGSEASKAFTYSFLEYANKVMDQGAGTDLYYEIIANALNMGSEVQKVWGQGEAFDVPSSYESYVGTSSPSGNVKSLVKAGTDTFKIKSAMLNTNKQISLVLNIADNKHYNFTVNLNGAEYSYSDCEYLGPDASGDKIYRLTVPMNPWDYDVTYDAKLYDSNKTLICEITYSVNSYCCSKSSDSLAVAIYNYGLAAEKYFA